MTSSFWKAFGPGLLWAGAAIGVSHLVQSTRAGAVYGFGLLGVILLALIFKYPAFSFGPRYAAATGTSLLEGYRRQGKGALLLYALLTLGTMFTVQAAVTVVTAALGVSLLGLPKAVLGLPAVVFLSIALTAACAGLLLIGQYRWLDKIIKVVVVVLTIATLTATALVLPKVDWSSAALLPPAAALTGAQVFLVVGLIGWMPSAFDISIWHSLWTLARRRETRHAPSVRDAMIDFKVGYLGTALLALCFLTLGAGVMYESGQVFEAAPAAFAAQIVNLYTQSLRAWELPAVAVDAFRVVITVAAFAVMFSTTLTVVDGFPRAIATLAARFRGPEAADQPSPLSRWVYWFALLVLGVGAVYVVAELGKSLKRLVDVATVLSFLTAPALAWLNHRAILGPEVPGRYRPGPGMRLFSWAGILFSLAFALYFLYVRFLSDGVYLLVEIIRAL